MQCMARLWAAGDEQLAMSSRGKAARTAGGYLELLQCESFNAFVKGVQGDRPPCRGIAASLPGR